MNPRPPVSTPTEPLFPYTTLCRYSNPAVELKSSRGTGMDVLAWDYALLSALNRFVDAAPAFDTAVVDAARNHLLKGGVLVAMLWWCWTRSEEHTSELQSLMRSSYAVFCLQNKIQ